MRSVRVGVILGLALAVPGSPRADDEPVLHEYVAPPARGGPRIVDPLARLPRLIGEPPTPGRNPAAIHNGERLLPEPAKRAAPGADEPLFGGGGFAADRETFTRLDRETQADDTLRYAEVFNPSVVPFKRMSALDAVHEDYTLTVFDEGLVDLRVGGATAPDRDLFWGSLVLELFPGRDVAIPSVAPDMRILSYEVEPAASLVFAKDGADNYYVRAEERDVAGTHRLVFLVDAPSEYFGSRVPAGYTLADAARLGARPLPRPVRQVAAEMARHIGVTASMPLDVAVDRLVAYFRSFEPGDPPPATGDLYRDLTLARRGVCRHRAFAFVVTAGALGLPARFVANEAHAFAEIRVPERGWLRVDLGGASRELDVDNASDKSMHRPREADPFPKPPAYARGGTELRGGPSGSRRGATGPGPDRDPRGTPTPAPGPGLPEMPPERVTGKAAVELGLAEVGGVVYRGESLRLSGTASSEGRPAAGLSVDLYLAPAGGDGAHARAVGRAVTDAEGRFELVLQVPPDLALGEHEVFAATPGDDRRAPALSR